MADKKLRITWVKGTIQRPEVQKRTIKALGFKHLHETIEQPDNPAVRGMITKVGHLLKVEEVAE
jgi:large subunit ribosomal protein L30